MAGLEYKQIESQGPNPYDAAQTFTESGLSITSNKTKINSGSVELDYIDGTAASWSNLSSTDVVYGESKGVIINPNTDLSGVEFTGDENNGGGGAKAEAVAIVRASDNTQVGEITGIRLDGGKTHTIEANLSAGTKYYLSAHSDDDYRAAEASSPSYPYTSADIDITGGVSHAHPEDGSSVSETTNTAWLFEQVKGLVPSNSGSATLEWGYPTDIYEWDVATFTRTLDGETVDVYIAYSTDGGSTWSRTNSGNPVTRNYSLSDDSNISPSDDVRIEAEISRQDTSNNPTLDSAYRSWLV
jgi:hypothetical protein